MVLRRTGARGHLAPSSAETDVAHCWEEVKLTVLTPWCRLIVQSRCTLGQSLCYNRPGLYDFPLLVSKQRKQGILRQCGFDQRARPRSIWD